MSESPTDDEKVDIKQFFLLAMLWLPLGFAVWFYLAGAFSFPVGVIARGVLIGGFPELFERLTQDDFLDSFRGAQAAREAMLTVFEIRTAFPASADMLQQFGKTVGNIAFDVQPMIYGYGLPLIFGLVMSTPISAGRRALQMLIGFIAVLLVQSWGVTFEALKTVSFYMGPGPAKAFLDQGLSPTVIAYCYQVGYLVFPSLIPVGLWVAMNRDFFEALTLKAGLKPKGQP
jgi:hypothetical protein